MSWFARSIANTLQLDLDDEEEDEQQHRRLNTTTTEEEDLSGDRKREQKVSEEEEEEEGDDLPVTPGRGVKEDLSEITKTLTSKFWGVASFLAPPPAAERSGEKLDPEDEDDDEKSDPEAISGIRRDFAEIGGRFRSGISKLSNNIDVLEITKMASSFLQLPPEGDDYVLNKDADAIGVTDEVLAFVRDITMHPETWLDFPLPEEEDEDEDFELSDTQQEHALAVESLAPRLAALRIELCPGYMSESTFWKIYFVLLHPRLDPQAAELLSTPEIVKARALLTLELKGHSNTQTKEEEVTRINPTSSQELQHPSGAESASVPLETPTIQPTATNTISADSETEKHPIPNEEVQMVDKSVIQEEPRNETKPEEESKDEDDTDDWLKEDSSEHVTGTTTIPIENDEDVSFSDLEEDDGDAPTSYKKTAAYGSDSSTKDSRDWVQLGRSSADSSSTGGAGQVSAHNSELKESNDWLDVDDIDVA
ncbi:hypothetical protein OSB04_007558 [Centaurea solstitialis]|uniref:BSD domain-containing protein n=1 Tax=Centaurea solstitialis TaxID=347529 RepID=A0AA38TSN7_9ASTR|nr:hypothetical protein OSB04_007558 [Centaurea solstitialis]